MRLAAGEGARWDLSKECCLLTMGVMIDSKEEGGEEGEEGKGKESEEGKKYCIPGRA